jgi:hypothetical protein
MGYSEHLLLSSYCLDRNISKMFDLWGYIFEVSQALCHVMSS